MRVEIDRDGKITVFDENNNVVNGVRSGVVRFGHDDVTTVEIDCYMMVDGSPRTASGKP